MIIPQCKQQSRLLVSSVVMMGGLCTKSPNPTHGRVCQKLRQALKEDLLTVDGVGLYLEDMILVTPVGAEVLTKGLPYSSFEIEAAVRTRK